MIITTIIHAYGVRLMSILNNIGVATEILGMLVFGVVLLIFAHVQSPSVLTSFNGAEAAQNGNIPATFLLGMFMAVFIVYGFDTAGTYGEETLDAGRQAPRGVLASILVSFLVGLIFIPAVILASPDLNATMAEGAAGGYPIGSIITGAFTQEIAFGISFGELYLVVILASVFVCTMAIQGAASRLMFSMARDRHLAGWGVAWPRQPLQDPRQRDRHGRGHRGAADPRRRADRGDLPVDRGHGPHLHQLLPVQCGCDARPDEGLAPRASVVQPWPLGQGHQHRRADLGRD